MVINRAGLPNRSSMWKSPIPHGKHELQGDDVVDVQASEKNPFIYNPFGKKRETVTVESVLVQGEVAEFRITLQNPFEFDVEVESIELDVKGVEFITEKQGVVLSPFRTQQLSIFGKPTAAGSMSVMGCKIKVFGCTERTFPIFTEGFDNGKLDIKVKKMGLSVLEPEPLPSPNSKRVSAKPIAQSLPTPKTIPVTVIETQPLVAAHSSSLPQSAAMVLEGERKMFNVVFQNLTDIPVDILFFSFQDSTTTQLQAALASKDMQPSETYEYEILLLKKRALVWKNHKHTLHSAKRLVEDKNTTEEKGLSSKSSTTCYIGPRATASFDIEVLGKPGLTNASIQLDYGYLGIPREELTGKFYTRQVVFPVTVTVNASIELLRVDFIPFSTAIDFSEDSKPADSSDKSNQFRDLFRRVGVTGEPTDYCLMTLDLRNAWPQPLRVKLQVREPPSSDTDESGWVDPYEISDIIQAGHQHRFVILIKRVYLPNPTAKIPSLSGSKRQFVVSTTKPTIDQERLSREAFWYREEILKCIRGTWSEVGSPRHGEVELRNFRLSPRMVETVRVDDVGIKMEILISSSEKERSEVLCRKAAPSKYVLETDVFYILKTTIVNRTSRVLLPLLRLSPSLRNMPMATALDLSRRFAFDGLLQHALGRVVSGECVVVEMGFVVLCRGEFEVTAGVEEVRLDLMEGGGALGAVGGKGRLGVDGMPEDVLEGVVGRRSWVGRDVLVLVARDV